MMFLRTLLKFLAALALLPAILALAYLAVTVKAAAAGQVPGSARDLDCDGSVSAFEWYSAGLDYGWRAARDGSPGCMELFSLKDGLPAVCVCSQPPSCRVVNDPSKGCSSL
jgi:hypothetical protein